MRRMRSIMGALAANTAGYAALQAQTGGTALTLVGSPQLPNPVVGQLHNSAAPVTLTSAGNVSAGTFTVIGLSRYGNVIQEIITGPNATTVSGHLLFTRVTSITPNTTSATTVSAGWGSVNYGPWLITAYHSASAVTNVIGGPPTYGIGNTDFHLLDPTYFAAQVGGGGTPGDQNSGGWGSGGQLSGGPYIDIPNTPFPLVPAALQTACPQLLGTAQTLPEDDGTWSQRVYAPPAFTTPAVGAATLTVPQARFDPTNAFAWRLEIISGTGLAELDVSVQRRAY